VVDNNSPDKSAEMIRQEFPSVRLIANKDNRGFAAANNQALKVADAKYYLLLNPDTEVLEGAIDKMVIHAELNGTDLVTCRLLNTNGSLQKSVGSFYSFGKTLLENRFSNFVLDKLKLNRSKLTSLWDHDSVRQIEWARGAVLLFSKKVFNKVGLLDERFFIYGEEIDFYFRANKKGFKSVFIPNAEIIHHGKSSSKQKRAEMFIQNYKSFYQFLRKNYSLLSYYLYRSRVYLMLLIWFLYYYSKTAVMRKPGNDKIQYEVYQQTLLWHLSRKSFIQS
jgi:GT2 family glycosyltransferase